MSMTRHIFSLTDASLRFRLPIALIFLTAPWTGCMGQSADATDTPFVKIEPLTRVNERTGAGYFSDPNLIHFDARVSSQAPIYISGTTNEFLICGNRVRRDCAEGTPVNVDIRPIRDQAEQAGAVVNSVAGIHPFQDSQGRWQMVMTLHIKPKGSAGEGAGGTWSVIVHATPMVRVSFLPPTDWTADKLLIGSLSENVPANYDGKYFEDNGTLYLLYSKRLSLPGQAPRDGIVAQEMTSFTELAPEAPVTLLAPNDEAGSLNSELYFTNGNDFKLVETGNITKINGKYAMAYSTGAFNKVNYKAAVAWSDTFLPQNGATYRKVIVPDPNAVWGNANPEVLYLLQSQKAEWPHDVASQVIAPGVPTIVNNARFEADGPWVLTFAGYAPEDAPKQANGNFEGNHRRPFFVELAVAVPGDRTVADATDAELATWITLAHESLARAID